MICSSRPNCSVSTRKLTDSFPTVSQVIPGSPAHHSGLRNGDIVDQINYQPTTILSHQRATDLIKSHPYSTTLSVDRQLPVTASPLTPPYSPLAQTAHYTPVPMYSTNQNSLLSPTGSSLSGGSLYRPQHLCSTSTGLGVFRFLEAFNHSVELVR